MGSFSFLLFFSLCRCGWYSGRVLHLEDKSQHQDQVSSVTLNIIVIIINNSGSSNSSSNRRSSSIWN